MKRLIWIAVIVLIVVLVIVLGVGGHSIQHWVAIHTGTENAGPDKFYNWWSGFGSDLGEVTLIGVIVTPAIVAYRHHECHTDPCHRLAHHTTPKGYKLCKKCIAKPEAELDLHEINVDHQ